MNIGQRIKARRTELGITLESMAKKLGKNRSTVYRYENGDIENMPLDVLEPIANVLQTTPAWLMGWDQEEIDSVATMQNESNEYFDSFETNLKDFMIEISEMGFDSSEIQRIRDIAHIIKQSGSGTQELHKAYIDLFIKLYTFDLTIDDLNDLFTYAEFLKAKKKG